MKKNPIGAIKKSTSAKIANGYPEQTNRITIMVIRIISIMDNTEARIDFGYLCII